MPDSQKNNPQDNNPLHGVKLADLLEQLVNELGWQALAEQIDINCFKSNPSIKSSLKFLRRTPWARDKVERLYLQHIGAAVPNRKTASTSKRPRQPAVLQQQIWGKTSSEPANKDHDS
ncbi:VF530 family protein [Marinobacterium arenosum]|nr:VF530 family protein [Marinobacterium arenosum]